jgi:hypothetical protein
MVSTNLFWKNSENKKAKALFHFLKKQCKYHTYKAQYCNKIEALSTEEMYWIINSIATPKNDLMTRKSVELTAVINKFWRI